MIDDLYIIVPTFNEEKSIKNVILDLQEHFTNLIIINDGSTDNTLKEIEDLSISLINNNKNIGQGGSIRIGLEFALKKNAKYFATFDSDGQHNANDLVKMYNFLLNENLDIVIGSRFINTSLNVNFIRKIILKLAIKIEYILYGLNKTDAHNGLRVFNHTAALCLDLSENRMAHSSIIIQSIVENNLRFKEFPVTINYNIANRKHKQKNFNSFSIFIKLIYKKIEFLYKKL